MTKDKQLGKKCKKSRTQKRERSPTTTLNRTDNIEELSEKWPQKIEEKKHSIAKEPYKKINAKK